MFCGGQAAGPLFVFSFLTCFVHNVRPNLAVDATDCYHYLEEYTGGHPFGRCVGERRAVSPQSEARPRVSGLRWLVGSLGGFRYHLEFCCVSPCVSPSAGGRPPNRIQSVLLEQGPNWRHAGLIDKIVVGTAKVFTRVGRCHYPLYLTYSMAGKMFESGHATGVRCAEASN